MNLRDEILEARSRARKLGLADSHIAAIIAAIVKAHANDELPKEQKRG